MAAYEHTMDSRSLTLLARTTGASHYARTIRAAAVLFVTALTVAAAQVSVPLPFTPVPLTLQPMFVLVAGAALGPRLGMTSQALYLAAGIAGLPVFAMTPELPQGPARLMGPTAGYLLSYPFAALVTGWLATRGWDRRYLGSLAAMAAGLSVIFAGGVAWLAQCGPLPLGLSGALAAGFYPFVLVDLVKLSIAAGALPAVWRLTGQSVTPAP
jgi:biotin transport system substrate-specific component